MHKQIQRGQSTSPTCREKWAVNVGKEVFFISGDQVAALKKLMTDGSRGLVWFGNFAVSIPHIQYIALVERSSILDNLPALPRETEVSEAERARMLDSLAKMREELIKKKVITSKHVSSP